MIIAQISINRKHFFTKSIEYFRKNLKGENMNFYNPYLYSIPATTSTATGLLSRLNFNSILNGTTKALNFVNQAIPVVKQVSPIMKNAKTMFHVMNEFKKTDISDTIPKTMEHSMEPIVSSNITYNNGPTFFI